MAQEKKNILIASLGYAPGVVTGTVDALKFFDGVEIHKVLTISTSDYLITNLVVGQILIPEFENTGFYPQGIDYQNEAIEATDIIDAQHNKDFLNLLLKRMNENILSPHIDGVYISLAGGRKTMASLVMTAVKLIVDCYGSWEQVQKFRELSHLLVDDVDVETYGTVEKLQEIQHTNEELFLKCIHPIKAFGEEEAKERVHLIRMKAIFGIDLTECRQIQPNNKLSVLQRLVSRMRM